MKAQPSNSLLSSFRFQLIRWYGLSLSVPDSWNPVRVEGDWDRGMLLLADLREAKLGVRWRGMRRGDPARWADRTMTTEVGELAAKEAKALAMPDRSAWRVSKLYIEPEPPGRNVWLGWSDATRRAIEIVQHIQKSDALLEESILPSLADTPADRAQAWSIFNLACRTPAGWALQWYRFNAGDLALMFRKNRRMMRIRQIAPASLALGRRKLDDWLGEQDKSMRSLYRPIENVSDWMLDQTDPPTTARRGMIRRRRRMFWVIASARELRAIAWHDQRRNRLLIVHGDDESAMKEVLGSMMEESG